MGWCFAPSGYLVAGDVMLAKKIALETKERATLAVVTDLTFKCRDEVHPQSPDARALLET